MPRMTHNSDNMQEKYLINALTCRHCLIHNNNQHDKVIL